MPIEIVIDRTPKVGNGMMVPTSSRPDAELKTYERIAKTVKPLENIKMFRVEYVATKPTAPNRKAPDSTVHPNNGTSTGVTSAAGVSKSYYEDVIMSSADKFSKKQLLEGKQKKRRIVDPSEFISILNSNVELEDFTADDTHSISSTADHLLNSRRLMNAMVAKSMELRHIGTVKSTEARVKDESLDNKRLQELRISEKRVARALAAPRKVLQEAQNNKIDHEIHQYAIELAATNAHYLEVQLLHLEKEVELIEGEMDGDLDAAISGGSSVAGSSVSGSRLSQKTEFFDTNRRLGIQSNKKPGKKFVPQNKSAGSADDVPLTAGANLEKGLIAMNVQFDKDMVADQKKYIENAKMAAYAAVRVVGTFDSMVPSDRSHRGSVLDVSRGQNPAKSSKLVPEKPAGSKASKGNRPKMQLSQSKSSIESDQCMSISTTVSVASVNQELFKEKKLSNKDGAILSTNPDITTMEIHPTSDDNTNNNDGNDKIEITHSSDIGKSKNEGEEEVADEEDEDVDGDGNVDDVQSENNQLSDDQSIQSAMTALSVAPLQPIPPAAPPPSAKVSTKLSISTASHTSHRVKASQNSPSSSSIIQLADKYMKQMEVTTDDEPSLFPSHASANDPIKQNEILQLAMANRNRKLEMLLEPILAQEEREARELDSMGKPFIKEAIDTLKYHSSDLGVRNKIAAKASFAAAPPTIALKDKDIAMMARRQIEREKQLKSNQPVPAAMISKAVDEIQDPTAFGIKESFTSLRNVAFAQDARRTIERQQQEWAAATDRACQRGVEVTKKLIATWENMLDLQEHYRNLSLQELKEKRFMLPQTIEFGYMEQSRIESYEVFKAFRRVKPTKSPSNGRAFITDTYDDYNSRAGVSENSNKANSLCKKLGHVHSANLAVKIRRKEMTKELKNVMAVEWYVKLLKRLKKTREASSVAKIPSSLLRFISSLKGIIMFDSKLSKEIIMNLIFELIEVGDHQIRLVYKMINTICEGLKVSTEELLEEYTKRKIEPHRSLRLQILKNAKMRRRKRQKSKIVAKRNMAKKKPSENFVNLRTLMEEEELDNENDEAAVDLTDTKTNVLTSENLRLMAASRAGGSSKFTRKLSFSNFSEDGDDSMSQLDDISDSMSEVSALEDFDEVKFLRF